MSKKRVEITKSGSFILTPIDPIQKNYKNVVSKLKPNGSTSPSQLSPELKDFFEKEVVQKAKLDVKTGRLPSYIRRSQLVNILEERPSYINTFINKKMWLSRLLGPVKGDTQADFIDRVYRIQQIVAQLPNAKKLTSELNKFQKEGLKKLEIPTKDPLYKLHTRYENKLKEIQKNYQILLKELTKEKEEISVPDNKQLVEASIVRDKRLLDEFTTKISNELMRLRDDGIKLGRGDRLPKFIRTEDLKKLSAFGANAQMSGVYIHAFVKSEEWFRRFLGVDVNRKANTPTAIAQSKKELDAALVQFEKEYSGKYDYNELKPYVTHLRDGTLAKCLTYNLLKANIGFRKQYLASYAQFSSMLSSNGEKQKAKNEENYEKFKAVVPYEQLRKNSLRQRQAGAIFNIIITLNRLMTVDGDVTQASVDFLKKVINGSSGNKDYHCLFERNVYYFDFFKSGAKADAYALEELKTLHSQMKKALEVSTDLQRSVSKKEEDRSEDNNALTLSMGITQQEESFDDITGSQPLQEPMTSETVLSLSTNSVAPKKENLLRMSAGIDEPADEERVAISRSQETKISVGRNSSQLFVTPSTTRKGSTPDEAPSLSTSH